MSTIKQRIMRNIFTRNDLIDAVVVGASTTTTASLKTFNSK